MKRLIISLFTILWAGSTQAIEINPSEGKQQFLDLLVSNPAETLQWANSVKMKLNTALDEAEEAGSNPLELLHTSKVLMPELEQECPIFLIDECRSCTLTRSVNPLLRECFESHVVASVLEKLEKNNVIHYANFGSGSLFQDLVIITKILQQQPDAQMVIHCIDTNYRTYATYQEIFQDSRQILEHKDEDMATLVQKFRQQLHQRGGPSFEDVPDADIELNIAHMLRGGLPFQQLKRFINQSFLQAQIVVHVHPSVQAYKEYIIKHALPYPDMLIAADIQDPESGGLGVEEYCKLCVKTLRNNPFSKNIWLAQYYGDSEAQICTVSLETAEAHATEEITIDEEDVSVGIFAEEIINNK